MYHLPGNVISATVGLVHGLVYINPHREYLIPFSKKYASKRIENDC